ncbi:uncharacterized protein LOC117591551 [Drosophila guanche]|uniref:uncharacterized protein LOC117591551 n=1 Tax=Drosophila guanche TaxID=7266 RepID=UPI00147172FD|nr:uncharacterized protein LOC117591551 [Drosophila guanche]
MFLLHNFSDGDNTAASLELQGAHLRVVFSYMAHDQCDPPSDLVNKITSDSERSNTGLLIRCDANAHHTQWGSLDINVRENPEDLGVLTPGHFLIGRPLMEFSKPDVTGLHINRLDCWQRINCAQ